MSNLSRKYSLVKINRQLQRIRDQKTSKRQQSREEKKTARITWCFTTCEKLDTKRRRSAVICVPSSSMRRIKRRHRIGVVVTLWGLHSSILDGKDSREEKKCKRVIGTRRGHRKGPRRDQVYEKSFELQSPAPRVGTHTGGIWKDARTRREKARRVFFIRRCCPRAASLDARISKLDSLEKLARTLKDHGGDFCLVIFSPRRIDAVFAPRDSFSGPRRERRLLQKNFNRIFLTAKTQLFVREAPILGIHHGHSRNSDALTRSRRRDVFVFLKSGNSAIRGRISVWSNRCGCDSKNYYADSKKPAKIWAIFVSNVWRSQLTFDYIYISNQSWFFAGGINSRNSCELYKCLINDVW